MYLDDNDTEGGAANGKEADIEPDYVLDSSDSDEEGVKSEDEDWVANDAVPDNIPTIAYDEENPPMTVGTLYPNMDRFRMALAQYAIIGEFEYNIEKSEPGRYRANCADENCDWRIYAKVMDDDVTIKVKINTMNHTCGSTKLNDDIKPASSKWVAEKIRAWLLEDATVRPKELRRRLHDKYGILVSYKKVYYGKEIAISQLYGSWDESFDKLYNYKAQIEKSNPGSIFVIDHHETAGAIRFKRLFFALKPCIDGFLQGCRPYLAIDSTFLTGKFKGQLATACTVDGHNWMYPVAFGVIDSETSLNWVWFMERLKDAIGTPEGLTICNDAGKGIDGAVHEVFPTAEHRECMMHLVTNFKKRYHGKVFDDHLWSAAYSWNPYHYNKHMGAIQQAKPEAIEYLRKNHIRLWSRSQFSTCSKVDYVTNNLAESFNNWVKKYKALNLANFFDKVGHKLMVKWELRRRISRKMQGHILPHVVKELNEKSRGLNLTVDRSDEHIAQVTCLGTSGFRHVVNLKEKTCTCCEWQLSGKPCVHTIALNCKMRGSMEQQVHEYFTVDKFRAAYAPVIHPLPDSSQWPKSEHGFMLHPPILKPVAGRRRTERYKGCSEKKKKGSHQCPICKQYGLRWHTCRNGDPDQMAAMLLERGPPKKRKKKKIEGETTIVPAPTMMYPPSINWNSTSSTRSVTGSKAKGGKSKVKSAASGQHTPSATKGKSSNVAPSSPAMNTRSKVATASSPAMGTRSKVPTASSPNVGSKRKLY